MMLSARDAFLVTLASTAGQIKRKKPVSNVTEASPHWHLDRANVLKRQQVCVCVSVCV